jgi:hypothetical protein
MKLTEITSMSRRCGLGAPLPPRFPSHEEHDDGSAGPISTWARRLRFSVLSSTVLAKQFHWRLRNLARCRIP